MAPEMIAGEPYGTKVTAVCMYAIFVYMCYSLPWVVEFSIMLTCLFVPLLKA